MLTRNIIIGLVLMAVSAAFFAVTFSFETQGGYVSPRIFPQVVSGCMFLLSAILVGRSLIERIRTGPVTTGEGAPFSWPAFAARWGRIAAAAAVAFVYTQVLESLGYVPATALFLAALVMLFRETRWVVVLAVAVLGTGVYYGVFRLVFKVPLPRFDLF